MKYKDLIEKYAKKHGIDPAWLTFVVDKESDFRTEARRYEPHHDKRDDEEQHKEAFRQFAGFHDEPNQDDDKWEEDASYGLCQIMGYTAIWLGWRPETSEGFYELYDPDVNLDLGAEYLDHLYSKFPEITHSEKERLRMATGAFNAGRGNINKMLAKARAQESNEAGETITIKDEGKWQTWEYASQFLLDVTGDWSKFTLDYIQSMNEQLPQYRRKFSGPSSIPESEVIQDIERIEALADEIERAQINLRSLSESMRKQLNG